jgi:hypothetical protein
MPKRTLSIELHDFYSFIKRNVEKAIDCITTSAFTQSRQKLNPDIFVDINRLLTLEFYSENEERIQLWEGFRLLSVDGSKITLPNSETLKEEYGTAHNQYKGDDVIQGRASVLYDVLNKMVIDALLTNPEQGEITLAHEHIKHIKAQDIIIFDRGYPSFELAYKILQQKADFVFRCKLDFSNATKQFISSGENETIVKIHPKQNGSYKGKAITKESSINVRFVRILLENGEVELLMSSLLDMDKYPHKIFKALYFQRWHIETFYNRIKNILAVENFSGLSPNAILQDFHCAMFISNVQSLIIEECKTKVEEKCIDRKYDYQINTSVSLGFMKHRIIDLFLQKGAQGALQELEALLITHLVPIQKGRRYKRETEKYRRRTKPSMFTNRKNVL